MTQIETLGGRALRYAFLAEVMTDTPIRAWSGGLEPYTLPAPDSREFVGVGTLGTFSTVSAGERIEDRTFRVGFHIAAAEVDGESYAEFATALKASMAEDVAGRDVRAYLALFDAAGTLVGGAPILIAYGKGSHLARKVTAAGAALELVANARLVGGFPVRSLFLTDDDQQALHPGDRFLEFNNVIEAGGRVRTWVAGT